jgi:zinc/manganese transport system substrate-binding protein
MSKRMHSRTTAKLLAAALLLAVLPAGLTACTSPKPAGPHKLKVVASTSVWGSIVEAIAGDKVEVTSIVNNPNQDPHSFEASVRDQAAVNSADLVLLTGNGYDAFMNQLIAASHQPKNHIVALAPNDTKVTPLYSKPVIDLHVWYDFDIVSRVANDIKLELDKADSANAAAFALGNSKFQGGLTKLKAKLEKASYRQNCHTATKATPCKILAYTSFIQPESVGLRMIAKFGIDLTPASTRQAVMNDTDISVQDMALMKTYFFGKIEHGGLSFAANTPVELLVLNAQATNSQTQQLEAWAKQTHTVLVVRFSESLPQGQNYLSWMSSNITSIESFSQAAMF